VARPIPFNENSQGEGDIFEAEVFAPAWRTPVRPAPRQGDRHRPRPIRRIRRRRGRVPGQAGHGGDRSAPKLIFLLVSGGVGGLAVITALGGWPILPKADRMLEDRDLFYLLAGGVYLVATTVYAGWRTRLMRELSEAPGDARLMALVNMAVGVALVFALGMVVMAAVAAVLILLAISALLISRPQGRPGSPGSAGRGMGAWERR
jgi:hypothetical protein